MTDMVDVTPRPPFAVFAALDISHGTCKRLTAGVVDDEDFGDPVEVVQSLVTAGARLLHVVDLDQAFERGENSSVIADVIAAVDVPVQVSGGINNAHRLRTAFDTGAMWVNLSADSLLEPQWVSHALQAHLGRVSVSLDVTTENTVIARGSHIDVGALDVVLAAGSAAGVPRYIVTDVHADGSLTGPNLPLASSVATKTRAHVIASGGIRDAADVKALADLRHDGVIGAVIGKALYAGTLSLEDAHAAAALHPRR